MVVLFSWTLTNGTKTPWTSQTTDEEASLNILWNPRWVPSSFPFRAEMPQQGVPKYCHKIHVYCPFFHTRKPPTSYHGVNFASHSSEIFSIKECWNGMGAEMLKQVGVLFLSIYLKKKKEKKKQVFMSSSLAPCFHLLHAIWCKSEWSIKHLLTGPGKSSLFHEYVPPRLVLLVACWTTKS